MREASWQTTFIITSNKSAHEPIVLRLANVFALVDIDTPNKGASEVPSCRLASTFQTPITWPDQLSSVRACLSAIVGCVPTIRIPPVMSLSRRQPTPSLTIIASVSPVPVPVSGEHSLSRLLYGMSLVSLARVSNEDAQSALRAVRKHGLMGSLDKGLRSCSEHSHNDFVQHVAQTWLEAQLGRIVIGCSQLQSI